MNFIREFGRWTAENESLLSGLAALAVITTSCAEMMSSAFSSLE